MHEVRGMVSGCGEHGQAVGDDSCGTELWRAGCTAACRLLLGPSRYFDNVRRVLYAFSTISYGLKNSGRRTTEI